MSPVSSSPALAVVIEGGLVQSVIIEDWPEPEPPRVVIVDYDTDDARPEELTCFTVGSTPEKACCSYEMPHMYEAGRNLLSPRAVLDALDAS